MLLRRIGGAFQNGGSKSSVYCRSFRTPSTFHQFHRNAKYSDSHRTGKCLPLTSGLPLLGRQHSTEKHRVDRLTSLTATEPTQIEPTVPGHDEHSMTTEHELCTSYIYWRIRLPVQVRKSAPRIISRRE